VAVLALPLVLLAVSTDWLYPSNYNNIDSWLYYGYLGDVGGQLQRHPDRYFGDRLPWLLPANFFHGLLPTLPAHWALKLIYLSITLLSFYRLASHACNARAALLGTIMFACYPVTLNATGWYYVDSAAACYFLLAMSCLLSASQAGHWTSAPWSFLAGACIVAMVVVYPLEIVLLPSLFAFSVLIARLSERPRFFCQLLSNVLFLGLGAAGMVLLLICVWHHLTGNWHFFKASLAYLMHYGHKEASKWLNGGWSWPAEAFWLTLPIAVSVGSCITLAVHGVRRHWREKPLESFFVANTVAVMIVVVLMRQLKGSSLVEHPHHAFLLTPVWFLGLPPLMSDMCAKLSRLGFAILAAICSIFFVLPLASGFDSLFRPTYVAHWHTLSHLEGYAWLPPALWVVGLLCFTASSLWPRNIVVSLGFITALAGISGLGATVFYAQRWHAETGGIRGFQGVIRGVEAIRRVMGESSPWIWFSNEDPLYGHFVSISACELSLLQRWYNDAAPTLPAQRSAEIAPGETVLVLTGPGKEEVVARSRAELEGHGIRTEPRTREEVRMGSRHYALSFLKVTQRRFEAELSPSCADPGNTTVTDSRASGNAYRFGPKELGNTCLVFGPGIKLPPGRYRVDFDLCTDDPAMAEPVVYYDVISSHHVGPLAMAVGHGTDFPGSKEFMRFTLVVTSKETIQGAQFRVVILGKAGVGVDYIEVSAADEPGEARDSKPKAVAVHRTDRVQ
jgi:hypothetical protein